MKCSPVLITTLRTVDLISHCVGHPCHPRASSPYRRRSPAGTNGPHVLRLACPTRSLSALIFDLPNRRCRLASNRARPQCTRSRAAGPRLETACTPRADLSLSPCPAVRVPARALEVAPRPLAARSSVGLFYGCAARGADRSTPGATPVSPHPRRQTQRPEATPAGTRDAPVRHQQARSEVRLASPTSSRLGRAAAPGRARYVPDRPEDEGQQRSIIAGNDEGP